MTIVLHIGAPKTGSSAIQLALARDQARLARFGVHYGLGEAEKAALRKEPTSSGNGARLGHMLNPRHPESARLGAYQPADFRRDFVSPALPFSLISGEGMAGAGREQLLDFRDRILGGGDVRVIAFVRPVADQAASTYLQMVKTRGYARDFDSFCRDDFRDTQGAALRLFAETFGADRVQVLGYERSKADIYGAFLGALGMDWRPKRGPAPVNRSLSQTELDVLLACNAIYRRPAELAQLVSRRLLAAAPDKPPARPGSPETTALLGERHADAVAWVNSTFFAGEPVLTIEGSPAPATADEPAEAVWIEVVRALADEVVRLRFRAETG